MAIPDSQLEIWSHVGATEIPERTYASIKQALSVFRGWSTGVAYDVYLSGSYRNNTHIHGNSDVDVVAELTSVYYSNLSDADKAAIGLTPAAYSWSEFRQHVINALVSYYGSSYVDTSGSKSIKVLPANGRQKADVVAGAEYKYYENLRVRSTGIIFWTQPGQDEIINYPKVHYENGVQKNALQRTHDWYKKTIRVYKNARDSIYQSKPNLNGRFPSYFIECLLYNVPDAKFGVSYQTNFLNTLTWLNDELWSERANGMICQNGMYYLFSNTLVTWNLTDAKTYVRELIELWNNW